MSLFSQLGLPASSILVTIVASTSGVYPFMTLDPFMSGTPATHTLSLIATLFPFSSPSGAPGISHFQYLRDKTESTQ